MSISPSFHNLTLLLSATAPSIAVPTTAAQLVLARHWLATSDHLLLMGAGASVDAGAPTAVGLTDKVVEAVNVERWWDPAAPAFVVRLRDALRDRTGKPIDIERFYSTLLLLSGRDANALHGLVDRFSVDLTHLPSDRPATMSLDLLARATLRHINEILSALDPAASDYLAAPLDSAHAPRTIATLNYDRLLEGAADRAGKRLDSGAAAWDGGREWPQPDRSSTPLLKLHGSIGWYKRLLQPPLLPHTPPVAFGRFALLDEPNPDAVPLGTDLTQVQIFGEGDKVRVHGPTLPLLRAFEAALNDVALLVVAGYSFRDSHINAIIVDWVAAAPNARVIVIDPGLEVGIGGLEWKRLSAQLAPGDADPASLGNHHLRMTILSYGAAEGLSAIYASV
ncbi:hypothetical protein L332_13000 [Agrococcus pavilionensis RW1]|uniref:Uncharacterized protein n=1 Tax=Agrococcus pavilionensis RW1 TaxID=1330458 RepID=U1MTU5_9MICO|nr:SIR2 family protein [Agrococcus pavilionensis]ERG65351.1 hypothetical protein L332_13000 [Agrococcus pavilionensis RW1]